MEVNTTFNNIAVVLWQSVLLMEETRVHRENHGPVIMTYIITGARILLLRNAVPLI
jgi:hypothetical protein